MINAGMRLYDYYTLGNKNEYGQPTQPDYTEPTGQVKMSISLSNHAAQDNVLYRDCQYIGVTMADVNDKQIIDYNGKKLKIAFVAPHSRFKLVYMSGVD